MPFVLSLLSLSLSIMYQVPLSVPSQPNSPKIQAEQPPPDSGINIENGVEALSLEDTPQVSTLPDSLMPAPSMVVRSTPQKQPAGVAPPLLEGLQPSQQYSQQGIPPVQPSQGSSIAATSASPQTQPGYHPVQPNLTSGSGVVHSSASSSAGQSLQPQLGEVYSVAPPTATKSAALPGASNSMLPHGMPVSGSHGYMQTTPTIQATSTYGGGGAPQMTRAYPSTAPPLSSTSQAATFSGLPTAPPTISLPSIAPTISLGPTPNLMSTNTAQ